MKMQEEKQPMVGNGDVLQSSDVEIYKFHCFDLPVEPEVNKQTCVGTLRHCDSSRLVFVFFNTSHFIFAADGGLMSKDALPTQSTTLEALLRGEGLDKRNNAKNDEESLLEIQVGSLTVCCPA